MILPDLHGGVSHARARACSEDSSSKLLDEYIGQERLRLKAQRISLGRHNLCLIEPADVDAVIDMYIAKGVGLILQHAAKQALATPTCKASVQSVNSCKTLEKTVDVHS